MVMNLSVCVCDRCGRNIRGTAEGFRVSVKRIGSGRSIRSVDLCDSCIAAIGLGWKEVGIEAVHGREEMIGQMIDRVIREFACERVKAAERVQR